MTTLAASPPELRAMLAQQGRWTGGIDVLDSALDELRVRAVAPRFAVAWLSTENHGVALPHILVLGDRAVLTAALTPTGIALTWFHPVG